MYDIKSIYIRILVIFFPNVVLHQYDLFLEESNPYTMYINKLPTSCKNIISLAMIEIKEAVENIDEILSVPNLTGVYIGPGDMSSSYGFKPQFDVEKIPIFSNIKMIAEKATTKGKIAGIHNRTTDYAKEMI